MIDFIRKASTLLRGEEGVTAIEYAVVAALIFVVVVATIGLVGTNLYNNYWVLVGAAP